MKKGLLIGLVSLFFIAATAMAWGGWGHRGYGPEKKLDYMIERLTEELSLTEEQVTALNTLKKEVTESEFYQRRFDDDQRPVRMGEIIHEQLANDTFDKEAIQQAIDERVRFHREAMTFMLDKVAKFHKILTPEQRKQLSELGPGCFGGKYGKRGGRGWGRHHRGGGGFMMGF